MIEDGYNVSCQYAITEYIENLENKLHNSNLYDKEILNGVFEHLAIVKNPRYEGAFIAANAYIVKNNNFKEQDHPRDDEGRFTEGEGSATDTTVENWGNSYSEFSGKPNEAIKHLLKSKDGYVPAAISKDGIGDIDFVYGKGGDKGFGLAHIIERRNQDGVDGEAFVKQIPKIIQQGEVKIKPGHKGRKYISTSDNEVSIRLDYNGEERNWIVSAYVLHNKAKNSLTQADVGFRTYDINYSDEQRFPSSDLVRTTNIISNSMDDFNPIDFINDLDKGGVMDEKLKELCAGFAKALLKAKNEADEEKEKTDKEKEKEEKEKEAENRVKNEEKDGKGKEETASNEDVDKRKNIREVEAALFEKGLPKELVYWVTKLMEENSYNKSEAGTADNKAKNQCKNEDETKEGEYDKLKEEIFEEVKNQIAKNSMDALKSSFYAGKAPGKKLYVSQKEGLELGKQIYG